MQVCSSDLTHVFICVCIIGDVVQHILQVYLQISKSFPAPALIEDLQSPL